MNSGLPLEGNDELRNPSPIENEDIWLLGAANLQKCAIS